MRLPITTCKYGNSVGACALWVVASPSTVARPCGDGDADICYVYIYIYVLCQRHNIRVHLPVTLIVLIPAILLPRGC